jgi:Ca2+-binding EF-hand superfamily protein
MTELQKEVRALMRAHGDEFTALRFYEKEITLLYQAFKTIDKKGCGWISIASLFRYIRMEETNFSRTVFSTYDDKNTGFICFRDFLVIVWNICTLPPTPLSKLLLPTFCLYRII